MENKTVWIITAKSNLHVGNENTSSYGLIDKAIQRDALTGLPNINSSSLKGALNEYTTQVAKLDDTQRLNIFGVDRTNKNTATQKGNYVFFDANILFLPAQRDNQLYQLITCNEVIELFINKMKLFGVEITREQIKSRFNYDSRSYEEFRELCSDNELPIIARNCLENGESKNLWYEQIIPQEAVFYTLILSNDDVLENSINNKIVQIGANATIGYGYCQLTKF